MKRMVVFFVVFCGAPLAESGVLSGKGAITTTSSPKSKHHSAGVKEGVSVNVPEFDLEHFRRQVAGHRRSQTGEYVGLLRDKQKQRLLKPLQKPPCGDCEKQFYERSWNLGLDEKDPLYSLRPFLAEYYGMRNVTMNGTSTPYMELEDVTAGMLKPCIVDIKIGAQTWVPTASKEKIQRQRNKYSNAEVLGFAFAGMAISQPETEDYLVYDKKWAKSVNVKDVPKYLDEYFNAAGHDAHLIVGLVLKKLRSLERWFKEQKRYAFYSSSILLAYDAVINVHRPHAEVRMIDFAYVFDRKDIDTNYLEGLTNLIKFIEPLQETSALSKSAEGRRFGKAPAA